MTKPSTQPKVRRIALLRSHFAGIRPVLTLALMLGFVLMALMAQTNPTQSVHAQQSDPTQTSPTGSTANSCLDEYEGDGIPSLAKPIMVGETQSHMFCPAGDADWLTFFAVKGKGYKVETSRLDLGVDTVLYLFAPDERTLLGSNDDAPGAHGLSQILFYPQKGGWYYVQAKNQGDIGYAGLRYSISLSQIDTPTNIPVRQSTPAPTSDLLYPQPADGGIPVFVAGPADAMQPDDLEPNDTREQAKAVNVGAKYKYLNFVPFLPLSSRPYPSASSATQDTDFFMFHTKPGLCYLVQTSDLSVGLDTTLILWQPVSTNTPNRGKTAKTTWKLVAQNDDAHPHTADLSSAVRWCAPTDTDMVIEVRNYGGKVATDPRGKSYSLSALIDAPAHASTPKPPAPIASIGGVAGPSGEQSLQALHDAQTPLVTPTTPIAVTSPQEARVDVVAYIENTSSIGPNPGDGIVGLPVLLMDVRTNSVIQQALTDANGHAQLNWVSQDRQDSRNGQDGREGQGGVRVAMPAFRWGKTLQLRDFNVDIPNHTSGVGGTLSLLLQARMSAYELPGIYP